MCGIAGIWRFNDTIGYEEIKSFTDSMQHRGPDGSGYELFEQDGLALGHRRLSILDLSEGGQQPMYSGDRRYCVTYNGEVYNFIEIKKELETRGVRFKTTTDTEVILAAYQNWGEKCFTKFNGMWAIAIWDSREKTLLLCRDRFGVKPLHVSLVAGRYFAFASETIAFKHLAGQHRSIHNKHFVYAMQDMAAIEAMGYTIYENIFQLLPGHVMRIKKHTTVAKQERWWHTYENLVNTPTEYNEQVEQFYELFKDACRIRMRSDVPLASALSGGVDSSSVYCMLHHLMLGSGGKERINNNWQQAYVGVFPGTTIDERSYADEVINYIGVPAVYVETDRERLAADVVTYTKQMDAITNTPISVVADIYRAMRQSGFAVSIDGHGADELMFGYVNSIKEVYYQAMIDGDEQYANDVLNTYLRTLPAEQQAAQRQHVVNRGNHILAFEKKMAGEHPVIKGLKRLTRGLQPSAPAFNEPFQSSDWFQDIGYVTLKSLSNRPYHFEGFKRDELELARDFHLTDIPYNLRDFDRGAMFSGVEIRMPFMDYRLVSYLFSLETKSKIGGGYNKRILRDAMKLKMPEPIRTRTLKIGLGAPMDVWLNQELKELLVDSFSSQKFLQSPYWNATTIKNFVTQRITSGGLFTMAESTRIWNVLNAYLIL